MGARTVFPDQDEQPVCSRLEESLRRYRSATSEYRRLLQEHPDGAPPGSQSALALARQEQTRALVEHLSLVRALAQSTSRQASAGGAFAVREFADGEDDLLVAIIDDDESVRDSTRQLLRSAGHTVETFASAEAFLDSGALGRTECIVLDVRMPGIDGLELQRRLNASSIPVPVVFVTAHDDTNNRRQAVEQGALDFLTKPFDADTLLSLIDTAIGRQ